MGSDSGNRDDDYEYGFDYLFEENEKWPADADYDAAGPEGELFDCQEDDPLERLDAALTEVAAVDHILWESEFPLPMMPERENEADEGRAKLKRELKAEALTRFEEAAQTVDDFNAVIATWDKLDRNRERRERSHELQRGDVPLDYGQNNDGLIFPRWLMNPMWQQMARGNLLDILFDCPYEMHELMGKTYLRKIVMELKEEHKEILFFLYLRLYSPQRLAALRGQTDRNIRKVRDVVLRKLRKKAYNELVRLCDRGYKMTDQERKFLQTYESTEGRHEKSV